MIVELKLNLVWDREVCRVGAGERLMRFAGGVKLRPRIHADKRRSAEICVYPRPIFMT
jgi:hypothetical protein